MDAAPPEGVATGAVVDAAGNRFFATDTAGCVVAAAPFPESLLKKDGFGGTGPDDAFGNLGFINGF
jgi:hypothetical protein